MLNQPTGTESITRHVLESYNLTVPAVTMHPPPPIHQRLAPLYLLALFLKASSSGDIESLIIRGSQYEL